MGDNVHGKQGGGSDRVDDNWVLQPGGAGIFGCYRAEVLVFISKGLGELEGKGKGEVLEY